MPGYTGEMLWMTTISASPPESMGAYTTKTGGTAVIPQPRKRKVGECGASMTRYWWSKIAHALELRWAQSSRRGAAGRARPESRHADVDPEAPLSPELRR